MRYALLAAMICLTTSACTYYEVTEPTSGRTYYTHSGDTKKLPNGAIQFTDARSGAKVTLQSSELAKIPKEEYVVAVGKGKRRRR